MQNDNNQTNNKKNPLNTSQLRRLAEEKAGNLEKLQPESLSPEETKNMLHELQVHQIELEIQNEELRSAQSELEASKSRYFDLYNLAPVGYLTINEKGLILEANLTTETQFLVNRSFLINQPFSNLIFKEDHDVFYRHKKQLFETGEHQTCELRMLRHDKTTFWALLEGLLSKDNEQQKVCRVVISDISKQKNAEFSLRKSEEFIRKIIDSVDEGFIVIDRHYHILSANRAFCKLVNLFPEQIIDKKCYEIMKYSNYLSPEAGDECAAARTFDSGKNYHIAYIYNDSSGNNKNLEIKSFPITDETGQVISVIETFNDVTETKKLEEKLLQSKKMEAIGQLAGGVAHDFNNMLSIIIGYSDMCLSMVNPSDPINKYLKEILKASERSASLVKQLLTFARKQPISPVVTDINDKINSIIDMLKKLIGENIYLLWLPGKDLWQIKIDQSQIDQIMVNICLNARDAISGIGKITIETCNAILDSDFCSLNPDAEKGDYVMLTVTDNGCGMDKKTIEKIFEPFFTTKEVGRGTGLGLATVDGIVRQHKGFINVESKQGEGSIFKIYFPRYIFKEDNIKKESPEVPFTVVSGGETILLVEDETALLEMMKVTLEDSGYNVLSALTPDEAIQKARGYSGEIHLLLTDVIMPEMNGLELSQKLLSVLPNIKTLFMSGYPRDVIIKQGVLIEGLNFIQKPFLKKEITLKIREILDGKNIK